MLINCLAPIRQSTSIKGTPLELLLSAESFQFHFSKSTWLSWWCQIYIYIYVTQLWPSCLTLVTQLSDTSDPAVTQLADTEQGDIRHRHWWHLEWLPMLTLPGRCDLMSWDDVVFPKFFLVKPTKAATTAPASITSPAAGGPAPSPSPAVSKQASPNPPHHFVGRVACQHSPSQTCKQQQRQHVCSQCTSNLYAYLRFWPKIFGRDRCERGSWPGYEEAKTVCGPSPGCLKMEPKCNNHAIEVGNFRVWWVISSCDVNVLPSGI